MKSHISLKLDDGDRAFTSGDTISGVVRLDAIGGLDVRDIVVTLHCVVTTRNTKGTLNDHDLLHERKYSLLKIPTQLYPTEASPSPSPCTFEDGQYEYPFSVVIPCTNSAGTGALPPSFLYKSGLFDLAQVMYKVSAVVKTPHFFKSNLSEHQSIVFIPPNAGLQYNSTHVSDKSGFLLPSMGGKVSRLKFEPIHAGLRSSWKRAVSFNTVKIPLELVMEFSDENAAMMNSSTSRVLKINSELSSSLGLSLMCPFSSDALQKILFNSEHDHESGKPQRPEEWPDRASILVSHIKITLRGFVTYSASRDELRKYIKRVVVDRPLNHTLDFASFEPTEYYKANTRHNIFDQVHPTLEQFVNDSTVYRIPLQPSWFEGVIGDGFVSSFSCPNIDNYYNISIKLTVKSSPGDRCDTLKCSSNVVLMRNEPPREPIISPSSCAKTTLSPQLVSRVDEPPPPYKA